MVSLRFVGHQLSIYKDDEIMLEGISFWIKPDFTEKAYLNFQFIKDNKAFFSNPDIGTAELFLEQNHNCFCIKTNVIYSPKMSNQKLNNHLDTESAFGIDVNNIIYQGNFMANYIKSEILAENKNCQFWTRPFISDEISAIPMRTQGFLYRHEDTYTFALSVCDKFYKSWFCGKDDGIFTILAYSNDYRNEAETTIAIFSMGNNPYSLPFEATEYGMKVMNKNFPLKNDRNYPPILEYLGWCSWDAFHMDVSHEKLIAKAEEFKEKHIPVRWFMIDDMWGDVKHINRATMHSRELYSFKADENRFPNGLNGIVSELKDNYSLWVGVWHPITGYWHGFDPTGDIAKEYKDLLFFAPNKQLAHKPDYESAFKFYDSQHDYYKKCGIDFVKIDNQGNIRNYSGLISSIGEAASEIHKAIDDSVKKHFDGAIINCMGMTIENYWNRPCSVVSRFSGDFKPEDRKWFINHLLQCSYNSFVQGALYVGDWDMWWSDDEQSTKNAVLRSMSGGPVYISDELSRSIKEAVIPIVFSDGKVIRLKTAAMPTKDCLLKDCQSNKRIFKIFNYIKDGGVIAAFNIDKDEDAVSGEIGLDDIPDLPEKEYCVFDWFSKKTYKISKKEKCTVTLNDYNDFRLLHFIPINDGIAPIGILEKYMSPATFEQDGVNFLPQDDGTFGIYSEKQLPYKQIGKNLYAITVKKNEVINLTP